MEARTEGTGLIFDVKRFSLHDGPGIRTTIFFLGCPLCCPWCQNPESQPRDPRLFHADAKCLGCRACASACTHTAVQFTDDGRQWLADRFVGCGACSRMCPSGALSLVGTLETAANLERTVLRDRTLYARAGGGLTLSGGEPLAQPAFAREILYRCHEQGILTALDTTACAAWSTLEGLLPYNRIAQAKYGRLGLDYSLKGTVTQQLEELQTVQTWFADVGCPVSVIWGLGVPKSA